MYCDVALVVDAPSILSNLVSLKSDLSNIVEPDFGLLDQLLSLGVLTRPELADVRAKRTVYRRNAALLDLITSEQQCDQLLTALQRTEQQHVANFITCNGGTVQYLFIYLFYFIYLFVSGNKAHKHHKHEQKKTDRNTGMQIDRHKAIQKKT